MGDFLPWVCHNQVCDIHELVKAKFVEKMISLSSVSVEDEGFFPLEGLFVF